MTWVRRDPPTAQARGLNMSLPPFAIERQRVRLATVISVDALKPIR